MLWRRRQISSGSGDACVRACACTHCHRENHSVNTWPIPSMKKNATKEESKKKKTGAGAESSPMVILNMAGSSGPRASGPMYSAAMVGADRCTVPTCRTKQQKRRSVAFQPEDLTWRLRASTPSDTSSTLRGEDRQIGTGWQTSQPHCEAPPSRLRRAVP